MPAVAAHYYYGQAVLKLLPEDIKKLIEGHKPAFDLGLQGPDILFYYKLWKKNAVVELGHELHRQNADALISRALKNMRSPDPDAQAYLLGFVCHFVLDSTFHGRISQLAAEVVEHRLLESELDRQILEKHCGSGQAKANRHDLIRIRAKQLDSLKPLYPELNSGILRESARSFVFFTWLLDSKNILLKWLIGLSEKALHQEGNFTSMMVHNERSEKYFEPAREICAGMSGVTSRGAEAVENVHKCFEEDCALPVSFEKNFL
ncbi:MAG: hypothetical protein H6Q58_778 [Firmicutes bacterium]|nr:hypothetical protein [Bacillota bacterium]